MPMKHPGTKIDVPAPGDPTIAGGYTGFNSLDLGQIYVCAKQPVLYRTQIARAHGKPILVRMPDGSILASQYRNCRNAPNPRYPEIQEDAALCSSTDDGRTWSEPRYLDIPGRVTVLSSLRDGTLILGTSLLGQKGRSTGRLVRSADGGETWTDCRVDWDSFLDRPDVGLPGWGRRGYGEINGVLELPDGTLLLPCFAIAPRWERYDDAKVYILRSTDGGRSWGDATFCIYTDEVSLLRLPDGKLLAFARLDTTYSRDVWGVTGQTGEGGDTMTIMESADDGRSWSEPRRIGLGMAQVPGFPYLLNDGRMILIYGNRQFPFGCQVIASRDQGQTWDTDHFIMLSWFSWDNYGGHPRSLVLPDGSILTGYYLRPLKEGGTANVNDDITSHVVRWRVPENWPGA